MRSREWLVQKGLAKATRGRLSQEAHQALAAAIAEGINFDDYRQPTKLAGKPIVARAKPVAPVITKDEPRRKENQFWVIEKSNSPMHSDLVIAFSSCAACGRAVRYCIHDEPQPPKYINTDKIYFTKPVV